MKIIRCDFMVRDTTRPESKIQRILMFRKATDCGLKEAKYIVETANETCRSVPLILTAEQFGVLCAYAMGNPDLGYRFRVVSVENEDPPGTYDLTATRPHP